jgi:hypothetical protein
MKQKNTKAGRTWYGRGYAKGSVFARHEADYDELAAIYRAGDIPANWDLYRAQVLNAHLNEKGFDFKAYAAGFARACIEFFEKISASP